MGNSYRVATVACSARIGNVPENIKTMEYWTEQAVKRKAQLILFPEMNITGYATDKNLESYHSEHSVFKHIAAMAQKKI